MHFLRRRQAFFVFGSLGLVKVCFRFAAEAGERRIHNLRNVGPVYWCETILRTSVEIRKGVAGITSKIIGNPVNIWKFVGLGEV